MAILLRDGLSLQDIFLRSGVQVDHVYDRQGIVLYSKPDLPQIHSFRSNPAHLLASVSNVPNISLSWTVTGATSVSIRDFAGGVIYTSTDDIGMHSIPTPASDIHWTLTATNSEGSATSRWEFYRSVNPVVSLLTSQITQSNPGGIATVSVELSCRIVSHPWSLTTVSIAPELYGATSHKANRFFQNRAGTTQREGVVAQLRRTIQPANIGQQTTFTVTAANSLTGTSGSASTTITW